MTAARQPFRCSALYRRHLALGAQMAEAHGWRIAAQFSSSEVEARQVRQGVGLADDSWLGKLDVRGERLERLERLEAAWEEEAQGKGVVEPSPPGPEDARLPLQSRLKPAPGGRFSACPERSRRVLRTSSRVVHGPAAAADEAASAELDMQVGRAWMLAAGHALILCEPQHTAAMVNEIRRATGPRGGKPEVGGSDIHGRQPSPQPSPKGRGSAAADAPSQLVAEAYEETASSCVHVTDVTSAYTALLLAGPQSRDVLAKLTALDVSERALPAASCAQTGLAHVHAIVLREDIAGVLAYRLLVDRAYGEYIWDAILHAGHEFGIAPFGQEARRLLERG